MTRPVLMWFRRDLRLTDNAALVAAAGQGPVVPVFIHDETVAALGAAARFRLDLSLDNLAARLAARGSRLILRKGPAVAVLRDLIAQTEARALHYERDLTPAAIARDREIKAGLPLEVTSHPGRVLFDPWTVATGQGGFYKVYSPFWRAVRGRDVAGAVPIPDLTAPEDWPASDVRADWQLGAAMRRGAPRVAAHQRVGEEAACARLAAFLDGPVAPYKEARDRIDLDATSGLSENLAWGEIAPATIWRAGARAMAEGAAGAEHFLKELVWRDFAYHLLYHTPHIATQSWRAGWESFPWAQEGAQAEAWRRGQTGEDLVDAAMRALYVTGRMHNRARMIVASYLTKHLLTDWRVGAAWFAQTLTDYDPASNPMGWQWVAGCGPDAAPYFRVFNPATQAEKFDPEGRFRAYWLNGAGAAEFCAAVPRAWQMHPQNRPGTPIIDLKEGRARALAALEGWKSIPVP